MSRSLRESAESSAMLANSACKYQLSNPVFYIGLTLGMGLLPFCSV